MKVTFKNVKLRKFCESKSSSKKLRARLADLMAVESVQDLVYGKPHPLKGDRLGQFAVSLEGAERLVFEPSNAQIPCKEDSSIDSAKVTESALYLLEITMTEQEPLFTPEWVSPPGDSITDVIEERDWTQAQLSERLGYTEKHVSLLINAKVPITEESAQKLSRVMLNIALN